MARLVTSEPGMARLVTSEPGILYYIKIASYNCLLLIIELLLPSQLKKEIQ